MDTEETTNTQETENTTTERKPMADADRGTARRLEDSREVYRITRDPRAAIRAYCAGNRWAIANAKAVGNW